MKKYLFLVATLLLTVSMSISAQNYGNRRNIDNRRSEYMMRMTPQERVDLMTKELNLTDKEASEVLALIKKQEAERIAQVKENRSQRGTGIQKRDARRDEFRAMRDEQMKEQYEELAKIIGKERADKWNELRKDIRDYNRSGRMSGGRSHGYYRNNGQGFDNRRNFDNRRSDNMMRMTPQARVDLMTEKLDLTAEQAAQVLELCKKQEAERIAQVKEQRSQRGTGIQDRDARRDEFRAMREKQMKKHSEELVKIIGKEKADRWNELRQDVRDFNRAGRMSDGGRGYYRNNGRNINNRRSPQFRNR
ncbi:MAG: hypothetical protein PHI32_03880 [Dysgonamonadaceae bacterium]|nr:hypothetical protein [Dysgonamonadaceae bacterium]MDD4728092.1 hypothetical protein [Dysgonamonadaceae bacterium]